jgi:hypothetical protein
MDDQWELDTDAIQSQDSDYLYEHRPNRWRGAAKEWKSFTESDRVVQEAIDALQDRDLAIHLYNVWALKQKNRDQKSSGWQPPSRWSAWPLSADVVPDSDFMRRTNDYNDMLTYRSNHEQPLPSTELQEELIASVLRIAKDRFRKRQVEQEVVVGVDEIQAGSGKDSLASSSLSPDQVEEGDMMDVDNYRNESTTTPPHIEGRYIPVVSADDELSAEILRPTVRHILSQLDISLTILHNARHSAMLAKSPTPSPASSEVETSEDEANPRPTVKKGKEPSGAIRFRASAGTRILSLKKRTTDAHELLPGETEREMLVRVARAQKKKIPVFSDEEKSGPGKIGSKKEDHKKANEPLPGETERDALIRIARAQKKKIPVFIDPPSTSQGPAQTLEQAPYKKRGRPKKSAELLPGETEKEMLIRLARINKRKIPVFADDETLRSKQISTKTKNLSSHSHKEEGATVGTKSNAMAGEASASAPKAHANTPKRKFRRDWTDVITAAALAGFSPEIIARTTQRCAHVFGQGIAVHTLSEVPASKEYRSTTRYEPGKLFLDVDCDGDGEAEDITEKEIGEWSGNEMYGGVHVDGFLKPIKFGHELRDEAMAEDATSHDREQKASTEKSKSMDDEESSDEGEISGFEHVTEEDSSQEDEGSTENEEEDLIRESNPIEDEASKTSTSEDTTSSDEAESMGDEEGPTAERAPPQRPQAQNVPIRLQKKRRSEAIDFSSDEESTPELVSRPSTVRKPSSVLRVERPVGSFTPMALAPGQRGSKKAMESISSSTETSTDSSDGDIPNVLPTLTPSKRKT